MSSTDIKLSNSSNRSKSLVIKLTVWRSSYMMPSTEKKQLLPVSLETIKPFRSSMKRRLLRLELDLNSRDKIFRVRANLRKRSCQKTKREFWRSSSRVTKKRFRDQRTVIPLKDNMKQSWRRLRVLRRVPSMRTRFNS